MEREKLTKKDKIVYALIVLLGVVAFIISTVLLCKTEKAEAAVYDIPDYVSVSGLTQGQKNYIEQYKYLVVYSSDGVYFRYVFTNEPVFDDNGYMTSGVCLLTVKKKETYSQFMSELYGSETYQPISSITGANFNVSEYYSGVSAYPYTLLNYPYIPVPEVKEAYDRSGFIPSPTKARHVGLGLWKFDYMYSLGSIDGSGNTVLENPRVSYRISVPSSVLVQSWVDSGKTTFSEDEIVQWRKTGSHRKIEVMDYYSPLTCDKGYFQLNLKQAILDSWSLLYGDISEDMISQVIKFAYPDVCVTSAYYDDYGTHVYGPIGVFYFESFSSDAREVYSTEDFYLYGTGHKGSVASYIAAVEDVEDNEDEIQDWTESEEYKAALEENESLRQQVTILEDKLASVGSSDGNLWDTFDGVVESLKKASDGFVNIGKVIGNVFSFLPVEVSAMMIFVLTAVLVIAIYNAVRGR